VHFFGLANRVEAVYFIKNCQFFVMPSRVEPLGIVNLEAMACSKAVIASRVGGIPEVVEHGLTGLLVESCSEKALAAAIKRLMEDKNLRIRLGRNGRLKAEQRGFSWEFIADKHLEISKGFLNYED
ncbi:MAG: glycosyltransferase family 4 protein, partial [Candidatus Omnitrophota bacterium]